MDSSLGVLCAKHSVVSSLTLEQLVKISAFFVKCSKQSEGAPFQDSRWDSFAQELSENVGVNLPPLVCKNLVGILKSSCPGVLTYFGDPLTPTHIPQLNIAKLSDETVTCFLSYLHLPELACVSGVSKEWNARFRNVLNHKPFVSLCARQGFTPAYRALCWNFLLKAYKVSSNWTDDSSNKSGVDAKELEVRADVVRSLPEVEMLHTKRREKMVLDIVNVYALSDPDAGYCQPMCLLAATVVAAVEQAPVSGELLQRPLSAATKQAFGLFSALMRGRDLRSMFKMHLPLLSLCLFQLEALIKKCLPVLSAHLEKQQLEAFQYATEWYLTMFAGVIPVNAVLRLWDLFFCHGWPVFHQFVLNFLAMYQDRLIACSGNHCVRQMQKALVELGTQLADSSEPLVDPAASAQSSPGASSSSSCSMDSNNDFKPRDSDILFEPLSLAASSSTFSLPDSCNTGGTPLNSNLAHTTSESDFETGLPTDASLSVPPLSPMPPLSSESPSSPLGKSGTNTALHLHLPPSAFLSVSNPSPCMSSGAGFSPGPPVSKSVAFSDVQLSTFSLTSPVPPGTNATSPPALGPASCSPPPNQSPSPTSANVWSALLSDSFGVTKQLLAQLEADYTVIVANRKKPNPQLQPESSEEHESEEGSRGSMPTAEDYGVIAKEGMHLLLKAVSKKDWDFLEQKDNVHIWRKRVEDSDEKMDGTSSISCKGAGIIARAAPLELLKLLQDAVVTGRYVNIDEMCTSCSVVECLSKSTYVIHKTFRLWRWCQAASRDFCAVSQMRLLPDGTCVWVARSVKHPRCPPVKGTIRSTVNFEGWVFKPIYAPQAPCPHTPRLSSSSKEEPEKARRCSECPIPKILGTEATYVIDIELLAAVPSMFISKINLQRPLLINDLAVHFNTRSLSQSQSTSSLQRFSPASSSKSKN